MGNNKNLVPFTSEQSHEEAVKNGSKGGKASGKKRREQKAFKELCDSFLNSHITSDELKEKMLSYGVANEDISYKMAIVVAMARQAVGGNVRAFEALRDTCGEKPKDNVSFNGVTTVQIIDDLEEDEPFEDNS